jgi:hypothetical protein
MRRALAFAGALAFVSGTAGAQQQTSFEWLGPAREISRGWSASRDTPAMNMGIAPRPLLLGGGEFALASLKSPHFALRLGFGGMIELEIDGRTDRFHSGLSPGSSTGAILWRGAFSNSVAFAPLELGRALCQTCRLEGVLSYRHESQHYTGSNAGGAGIDVSGQPYVGDDLSLDAALSEAAGDWYFAERITLTWYLPERSSYDGSGGLDVHARFRHWRYAHPFCSLYAEYRLGGELLGRIFPDAYRLRALLGVALPSSVGDILFYGSGDVGNRYGIRILTREATLGLGIRLTLGRESQ